MGGEQPGIEGTLPDGAAPGDTPWSRTNPDFLFNALNSIEALSRQAPREIPDLVRGLARHLRYSLQPMRDGWSTLQQELDDVAGYLYVEQVRFEDRFKVEFTVADAARQQRVPKFLLQPLVEYFLYAGQSEEATPLRVLVSCGCLDGRLTLEVRSTGGPSAGKAA